MSLAMSQSCLSFEVSGVIQPGDDIYSRLGNPENKDNQHITLKWNAKIILRSADLQIIAQKLTVERGARIIAFETAAANGKDGNGHKGDGTGNDGANGENGLNAGTVTIKAIEADGFLEINLKGQAGGRGGHGAKGIDGENGTNERSVNRSRSVAYKCYSDWDIFHLFPQTCHRTEHYTEIVPPTNGTNGKKGGKAGRGGDGGNGGTVHYFIIDSNNLTICHSEDGGIGGEPGNPGKAGEKGIGGKGNGGRENGQDGIEGPGGDLNNSGNRGDRGTAKIHDLTHNKNQRDALRSNIDRLSSQISDRTRELEDRMKRIDNMQSYYPYAYQYYFEGGQYEHPYDKFYPNVHLDQTQFDNLINSGNQSNLTHIDKRNLRRLRSDILRLFSAHGDINSLNNSISEAKRNRSQIKGELDESTNNYQESNLSTVSC